MNTLINVHINCYNYLATGTVEAASGAGKGRRPTGAGNASMGVVVAGGGGGGWSDRGRLLRAAAMSNEAISQSACVMSSSSDSSSPPPIILWTIVDILAALFVRTLLSYVSFCIRLE